MRARTVVLGAAVACAWLLAAAPALARVTTSGVTVASPAGAYLLDDEVASPGEMLTGTGTSDGISGDSVDVNCYYGSAYQTLVQDIPVQGDGAFSFSGPLSNIAGAKCVLRAVPAGDTTGYIPGSPSAYAGPTLIVGERTDNLTPSGHLMSYDLYVAQRQGALEYGSLGGCTISNSYTFDPVTFGASVLDFCNAWFDSANGVSNRTGFAAPNRSELQVDGVNAYLPGNAPTVNGGTGYPALSYSYSIDPSTGNLELDESDQVAECSPDPTAYPPTGTSCSSFVPTGVQVKTHVSQGDSGLVATVIQRFSSTDGKAHTIDLLEDNEFFHPTHDGAVDFPWIGGGLKPYTTPGQVLPGPHNGGPGSFYAEDATPLFAVQGSVTFSTPPDAVDVIAATDEPSDYSWFDLHYYARSVPAAGSLVLGFAYGDSGNPAIDANAAERAFQPTVSITSPASGATVSQPQVTVSGTASDANGLDRLIVNGQPVAVGPNGAWSTTVSLPQGRALPATGLITAVATNVFGNSRQVDRLVNYLPALPRTPRPTPSIGAVGQSHSKWREGGRRRKGQPPIGTTFSFSLNEAARVRFVFAHQANGRSVNGRCVAPSGRNRRRPSCRRTIGTATMTIRGGWAFNHVRFKGTLPNGHKLAPGRYTVTLTAIDPVTGAVSNRHSLAFTIVR